MVLKLGMKHQAVDLYKVYINHDPGMTLTYFTARSSLVPHAFEWGKGLKYYLKGKTCRKWANKQNIYVYETILFIGGYLPLPWGYIHVHDYNIQTSSGQSKSNIMLRIVRKGH